ncbi:MAG: helix-turn-helix domain-containing protein [Candidatus Omnitrophica bacterium]|nr:helix-turn-helix domain-containing protein [Candidatus Omnitrophota bacterium]
MEKRFLGIKEMAEYLGLTVGTMYVWVCQKKIPYLKVGKLVKFDLKEIENWLKERRVEEIS